MSKCEQCAFFFPIPKTDMDFEPGKGDCVQQQQDTKGKFWLSKPVSENSDACQRYRQRT